jgi:hypothetical protein
MKDQPEQVHLVTVGKDRRVVTKKTLQISFPVL